ncbi:hypothetical protein ACM1RC_27620 [Paenibacillus azoreducens]|uniref:hypothetical protein n=1 Tax=Paenibacillus azoreducens TaxID=116718 RepID=UPI0039F54B58
MSKFNGLNATNSTIIQWEGKELRTTQDPYISDDGSQYIAHAVDDRDDEYIITWEVINYETMDESEACDWDNPVGVTLVK